MFFRAAYWLGWLLPVLLVTPGVAQVASPQPDGIAPYRQLIEKDPLQPESYLQLGEFLQTTQQSPQDAVSYYAVGATLAQKQRWTEAIAAYRQAISLKPDFALAHYSLAQALMRSQPGTTTISAEVLAAFRRAIELAPNHPPFWDGLVSTALMLREFGLYKDASETYQFLLQRKPNEAQLYIDYGLNLWYNEQPELAKSQLLKAIELEPKNVDAYIVLGDIWAMQKRGLEAQRVFQQALKLEEESGKIESSRGLSGMVGVFRQQNRLDKAISLYRSLVQRYPDQLRLAEQLRELILEQQQSPLPPDPRRSPPAMPSKQMSSAQQERLYRQATELRKQDQLAAAADIYQQIIAQDAKALRAYIELAETLTLQKQFEAAISYYRQAIALVQEPYSKAFFLNDIGLVYLRQGNPQAASTAFQEAIQLLPNYEEAKENLQQAEQLLNDRQKVR